MTDDNDARLGVAVGEIRAGVQHLLGSMAELKIDHKETRKELKEEISILSQRLTLVEQFRWKAIGISTTVASIVPLILTLWSKLQ